jgi:hypothetical protein
VLQAAVDGSAKGRKLKLEDMDFSQLCSDIAAATDGMSGREIAKLSVAWQAAGYASEDGVLTRCQFYQSCCFQNLKNLFAINFSSNSQCIMHKFLTPFTPADFEPTSFCSGGKYHYTTQPGFFKAVQNQPSRG